MIRTFSQNTVTNKGHVKFCVHSSHRVNVSPWRNLSNLDMGFQIHFDVYVREYRFAYGSLNIK